MNLAKLVLETIPLVTPPGWHVYRPCREATMLVKDTISDLRIIYSIATIKDGRKYHHVSFSRQDRLPSWEEMRDTIYGLPWFDHDREIFMTLPPKKDYVKGGPLNPDSFVLHWWQEIG